MFGQAVQPRDLERSARGHAAPRRFDDGDLVGILVDELDHRIDHAGIGRFGRVFLYGTEVVKHTNQVGFNDDFLAFDLIGKVGVFIKLAQVLAHRSFDCLHVFTRVVGRRAVFARQ